MKISLSKFSNKSGNISPKKRAESGFIQSYVLQIVKKYYKEIADVIVYDHWLEFARKFKDYSPNSTIIFRGQSNALHNLTLDFWQIQSNLNRSYFEAIELSEYLQNLMFSKDSLSKYGVKSKNISETINLIEIMAFLQHQGIPTPLVDFTKDPITAMFFAMSNFPVKKPIFEDALYHSVFEIDKNILENDFGIVKQSLTDQIGRLDILDQLPRLRIEIGDDIIKDQEPLIGLCHNNKNEGNLINTKLQKQDGEFIFLHFPSRIYQNGKCIPDPGLECLLGILKERNIIEKKPIKLLLIPYNSINTEINGVFYPHDLLFAYFKLKAKTGFNLFEDATGFKYDFMFNIFKNYSMVNALSDNLDPKFIKILIKEGVI